MLSLLLSLFISMPILETDVKLMSHVDEQCIAADKIIKPMLGWKIISTEFIKEHNILKLTVSAHNPLNTTRPTAADATFIFNINVSSGVSTSTYDLIRATFYNSKNIVTFDRIYETRQVKTQHKTADVSLPTSCFTRKI